MRCRGKTYGILTSNLSQKSPCQTKDIRNTNATYETDVLAVCTGGFCSVHWPALLLRVQQFTIRMPGHRLATLATVVHGSTRFLQTQSEHYPNRIRTLPHLHASRSTAALSRKRPVSAVISRDRCRVQVSYLLQEPSCTSKSPFTSPYRLTLSFIALPTQKFSNQRALLVTHSVI